MKKAFKIMGGIAAGSAALVTCYMLMNKKTRKKAEDLANTMLDEAKTMMK